METLDYDHSVFMQTEKQREADKNLAIRFFMDALQDPEASQKEGRLVARDVPFVEIRVRGDRNNIQIRPVRDDDKRRWPEVWRAFEAGMATPVTGTPLKEWPAVSKSFVMELNYLGYTTVEELANASDSVCAKVPGLQQYKQKAIVFLEFSKKSSEPGNIADQLNEMRNLIETQNRQLQEQSQIIARLQSAQGKDVTVAPAASDQTLVMQTPVKTSAATAVKSGRN